MHWSSILVVGDTGGSSHTVEVLNEYLVTFSSGYVQRCLAFTVPDVHTRSIINQDPYLIPRENLLLLGNEKIISNGTMSTSFLRAAKCRAVSPFPEAALSCSAVCELSNSLHIDWFPASTANRSGIFPFYVKFQK